MKKKGLIVTIIVLVVLIILAGGTFAYIYFGTDFLLSERQGFEKYALQLVMGDNKFISNNIESYLYKKENTSYTTNGNISADTIITENSEANSTENQKLTEILDYCNKAYISFDGKVDNTNRKFEQNISINYSDTVKFPFTIRTDGDVYGIQSDNIGSTFIAIENNNIPDLLQKFGIEDVSNVPNKVEYGELESMNLTEEEEKHILNTYILPIYNNITDDKFSKQDNSDESVTYTLTLTTDELKNILIQTLEIFKEDQYMIDKLNSEIQEIYGNNYDETSMEINQKSIQEIITEIENYTVQEGTVKFSITQKDRKVSNINISYGDIVLNISKLSSNQSVEEYNISISKSGYTIIELKISYSGINTNSVTEQYIVTLNIENKTNTTYQYSNIITFGGNISFESLNATNAAILNNYSSEQLLPFLGQVGMRIIQTNTEQMNELGYPTELINPLFMWFLMPTISSFMQNNEVITNETEKGEQNFNDKLEQDSNDVESSDGQLSNVYLNSEMNSVDVDI